MTRSRQALVIGGGIAGPVAAMALQRAGYESAVCDRAGEAATESGTYLTIATNGLDALRAIDAHSSVVQAGFATTATTMTTSIGTKLGRFSVGAPLVDGTVSQTIKRPVLHRVLRDRAVADGVTFSFDKRLTHAETTSDGGVTAWFSDGTETHADILVGCDGLHSPTRRVIDPQAPDPRYVGMVNFGGYTPAGAYSSPAAIESGVWHMTFGRRAFFGHVVDPSGGVVWFANTPGEAIPKDERETTDKQYWKSLLSDLSADDAGPIHEIVRNGHLDVVADNTYDLVSVPKWHNGSMVIIGDAAHAPSSISGQGASLAIEDAVMLAKCLRDTNEPAAAFASYERLRRPRVEAMVLQVTRGISNRVPGRVAYGRLPRLRLRRNEATGAPRGDGAIARLLRDRALRAVYSCLVTERSLGWTYNHHIDWDDPVEVALPA